MSAHYKSTRVSKKSKHKKSFRRPLFALVTTCMVVMVLWTGLDVMQLLMGRVLPPFLRLEPVGEVSGQLVSVEGLELVTPTEAQGQSISVADLVTISENILAVFAGGESSDTHLITTDHNIFDIIQTDAQDTGWVREAGAVEPFALQFDYDTVDELRSVDTLLNRFFTVNTNAGIGAVTHYFDIDYFLQSDLHIEKNSDEPQVLIFHTHPMSEFFADSPGRNHLTYINYGHRHTDYVQYGIMGVGATLAQILTDVYGINVLHHQGLYDWVDGTVQRSGSYERSGPSVERILAEHPSIQLVIDLHRDGIEGPNAQRANFVSYINGEPHARIMFVNGLSSIHLGGVTNRLYHLPNPYTQSNLALSFNLQMAMNERFPGLSRRTFLSAFRFVNHLRPMSLLVEAGMQYNHMQDVHNAMEPLAYLIYSVLFSE